MLVAIFWLLTSTAIADNVSIPLSAFSVAKIPGWVTPTPLFDAELEPAGPGSHGLHSRLRETQVNGIGEGRLQTFHAHEFTLTNRYGVEKYSRIEIDFHPGFQQLMLHELAVLRKDAVINKLDNAKIDLLRLERSGEAHGYDGLRTLSVIMDDIRAGDSIRYSYTIVGENPVFNGLREFSINTELNTATDRQFVRVLSRSDRPLVIRQQGPAVNIEHTVNGATEQWTIDQRAVPKFRTEADVPGWHGQRGAVVFSDISDWQAMASWASALYQLPIDYSAAVAQIARKIRDQFPGDEQRAGAALRWVQNEIRNVGGDIGQGIDRPALPGVTLAKRFGDSKDKAVLLIALLNELEIDAQPALVNTDRELESSDYPYRLQAFNHVLVQVVFDTQSHFLDPTATYQMGAVGEVYEPDYGDALVLSAETVALTPMSNRLATYRISVQKQLTINQSFTSDLPLKPVSGQAEYAATLSVVTKKQGRVAQALRYDLDTEGRSGMSDRYLDYYSDFFDDIHPLSALTLSAVSEPMVTVNENYALPNFWDSEDGVERFKRLYADEIISYLDTPDKTRARRLPYEIVHPVVIDESWVVSLDSQHNFDQLDVEFSNEWLSFSKASTLSDDGKTLVVRFNYRTLAQEVAAKDLKRYAESVSLIKDLAMLYLEDSYQPDLGAAQEAVRFSLNIKLMVVLGLLLMLFMIGMLFSFHRRSDQYL